jgi:hypothetical protein
LTGSCGGLVGGGKGFLLSLVPFLALSEAWFSNTFGSNKLVNHHADLGFWLILPRIVSKSITNLSRLIAIMVISRFCNLLKRNELQKYAENVYIPVESGQ